MRLILCLAGALILVACSKNTDAIVAPNESLASLPVSDEAEEMISTQERNLSKDGAPGISLFASPVVVAKTLVFAPGTEGEWTEEWVVQRSGYRVAYEVVFSPVDGRTVVTLPSLPVRIDENRPVQVRAPSYEHLRQELFSFIAEQVAEQRPDLSDAERNELAVNSSEQFLLQVRELTPETIERLRRNPLRFDKQSSQPQ